MINPQIFTADGKMVWQCEVGDVTHRVEQQTDGSLWGYSYYQGRGKGVPVRGAKRQESLKKQTREVAEALGSNLYAR